MSNQGTIEERTGMYTTLEEAKEEIWRRWNDKELRRKVEEYIGDIPDVFKNEPRAVLFRNIISPDIEFFHFLEKSKEIGLKPVGLEYTNDRFCTRNADKLGLCKLNVFEKKDKNGNCIVRYEKIVDLMKYDNVKFGEIEMKDGQNLVEFHHELLKRNTNDAVEKCDMSGWVMENGMEAAEYYKKFLAFFICHGVLFENFVTDESESEFEKKNIASAIKNIQEKFSLKPLVVALVPNPEDVYWWCYSVETIKTN